MNRLPSPAPERADLEHLRHRERIDWHDHAEQQLLYPSSGLLIVSTSRRVLGRSPAARRMAARRGGARAPGLRRHPVRTVAFPVHVNPLGLTQPTVLSVSRLLRELIIALTDDPARPRDEQR